MAWSREFPMVGAVEAERAFRLPMGAVSPLWAMFGAAAGVGVAYWWMTSWTRAVNIEALAGAAPQPPAASESAEIVAEPVTEATAEVSEDAARATAAAFEEAVDAVGEVAAAVAQAPAVEPPPPDDLTRMTGIGPKLSLALAERGVTRFAQIAAWTDEDLASFDAALGLKGRAAREAWVAQARRLAAHA